MHDIPSKVFFMFTWCNTFYLLLSQMEVSEAPIAKHASSQWRQGNWDEKTKWFDIQLPMPWLYVPLKQNWNLEIFISSIVSVPRNFWLTCIVIQLMLESMCHSFFHWPLVRAPFFPSLQAPFRLHIAILYGLRLLHFYSWRVNRRWEPNHCHPGGCCQTL